MQNFTELLNRSLVNPSRERLASLQNANEENTKLREALAKELQAANVRQDKLEAGKMNLQSNCGPKFKESIKSNKINGLPPISKCLISALEALKWNEGTRRIPHLQIHKTHLPANEKSTMENDNKNRLLNSLRSNLVTPLKDKITHSNERIANLEREVKKNFGSGF